MVVMVPVTVVSCVYVVGAKVCVTVFPSTVPVTTVPPEGRAGGGGAGPEFPVVDAAGFPPSELGESGMTGGAVGQLSALGCVVQLAQPIAIVPEEV